MGDGQTGKFVPRGGFRAFWTPVKRSLIAGWKNSPAHFANFPVWGDGKTQRRQWVMGRGEE